jgi:hypothetical protein
VAQENVDAIGRHGAGTERRGMAATALTKRRAPAETSVVRRKTGSPKNPQRVFHPIAVLCVCSHRSFTRNRQWPRKHPPPRTTKSSSPSRTRRYAFFRTHAVPTLDTLHSHGDVWPRGAMEPPEASRTPLGLLSLAPSPLLSPPTSSSFSDHSFLSPCRFRACVCKFSSRLRRTPTTRTHASIRYIFETDNQLFSLLSV